MNRLFQSSGASSSGVQLICFPFAGGYSAALRPLRPFLQDHCDFITVEPPGHGTNLMPLVDNLETLVDIYMEALMPKAGKPFVLFGHSMGGLVVYRLAQKLERRGILPEAIIISAVQPPHITREAVTGLDDGAFLDFVLSIGGIPSEIVEAREVLEYFLPALRADFKAVETFEHKEHALLQTPVHILNGKKDEKCMRDASGWRRWANRVRFHTFQGGHMFVLLEAERVAHTIQYILSSATAELQLTKA